VTAEALTLQHAGDHWACTFTAMASTCEVLVDSPASLEARRIAQIAATEAWRVEQKFSRYRTGNIVHAINTANGRSVTADEETARLIDFAASLTQASEGGFDITSGVLRKIWKFDGGTELPDPAQIESLRLNIGWHRVRWASPQLTMPPGMQIDLGGIGKEYAVDRAAQLIANAHPACGFLVNFGGDLVIGGQRSDDKPWIVGIESTQRPGAPVQTLPLRTGALATSGDARRYLVSNGKRYSHILDARTGWPVESAPHSVTVLARTCTEAGSASTLASLRGSAAGAFLESLGHRYWLQ
jgi:FAD:protein FMN transferase